MRCARVLTIALLLVSLTASPADRRRAVGPRSLDRISASVIAAPEPVMANGVPHIAWEILLRNDRANEILITSVDVTTIASYSGNSLLERILNVPLRPPISTFPRNVLRAGEIAVIYFLISQADVPPFLTNVIHMDTTSGAETLYVVTPVRSDPPVALSAPLRGGSWLALNGLHNDSAHRRAATLIDGRWTIAQRYAIDWLQVDERGSSFSGDVRRNSSFYAYGRDLLAVGDAVVASTHDGIPENIPHETPVVPITLETVAGNYVILDLGESRYALYAHLQPGSLRVKTGDHVTKGTVLGILGNSGNSSEPHLHFHVCDANASLACEGLPYVFDHFSTGGTRKELELPANNALVDFE